MSSIKIRIGRIEIEYEGSEEYLKTDFLALVNGVVDHAKNLGTFVENDVVDSQVVSGNGVSTVHTPGSSGSGLPHDAIATTNNVHAHLGLKGSAADVVTAAAAYLTFGEGKAQFTRTELHGAAKTATDYSDSVRSNFSSTMKSLTRQKKLVEKGGDNFALSTQFASELRGKLAN